MAKANIMNTGTTNYLDLIGNGKTYRVPTYQRDYSWTEEEWEDLWNDILELRNKPKNPHYMGALVIQPKNDREFFVIDGQQRLATIAVLTLAIIQKLESMAEKGVDKKRNMERAGELRNRFVGEKDPASLVESSRLHLNETDDPLYQDYLVQLRVPPNPGGLPRSNALLWKCYKYFGDRINEITDDARIDGEKITKILSETIARRLLFILITVDDELNAYTVFETLNARGMELTTTDLLKNYLFSKMHTKTESDSLKRRWKSLIATVTQEHFPDFLRYYLLCEQRQIRKQRLFKIVRERVKNREQAFELLTALEDHSELFAALADSNHEFWNELPDARPFIRELNLFRTRQMTPIFFAARKRFADDDFVRLLKLVSIIIFRYSIVSNNNTNALEPASHSAAKAVLDGNAKKPRAVFNQLRGIYVDDSEFENNFARWTISTRGQQHRKLAKYVLIHLEMDAGGRPSDPETDPATIEHVLPENPANEWSSSFQSDKWDAAVDRLGNLTLLENRVNRDIGNAEYAKKCAAYEKSAYALTRKITDIAPEEWTFDFLEERQRQLAARAVCVWKVDFE